MMHAFLGELVGTAMLILMGNSGWLVITSAWGLTVTFAVMVALAIGSNAHINPAVTIGLALYEGSWSHVPIYLAGQFSGAFIGAVLVWLYYLPHWQPTEDPALKRACFCTSPAIPHPISNFLSEMIASFVLIFVVVAIYSSRISADGLAPGIGPFLVGLLVWVIGMSLGGTTGYAINPARDLGPRIAHAVLPIAGKGSSGWSYAHVPVIGPVVGGSLGGIAALALGI